MNSKIQSASHRAEEAIDSSKRNSLGKAGSLFLTAAVLPTFGLMTPRESKAAVWLIPAAGLLLGYGFARLVDALKDRKEDVAMERLRDRMGGFEFPDSRRQNLPTLSLGQSGSYIDPVSRLHWPEWGYHDAKISERAPYSFPTSPREGLAYSDKEIFEEALRRRAPGLLNSGQAYARDYRDSRGNDLRIVAARLPDGQTYVAESNGRNATAYEIYTQMG